MFRHGNRGDVGLNVRVDALMDERHPGGVADKAEGLLVGDADVHGGLPLDGQAEPELLLAAEGSPVPAGVTQADAVDGAERAPERLGRGVAVPDGDRQQVVRRRRHVCRRERHPSPADVLRERHARQRGEHPAQVVLGGAVRHRHRCDVDDLASRLLDGLEQFVQCREHPASFRTSVCDVRAPLRPTVADQLGQSPR